MRGLTLERVREGELVLLSFKGGRQYVARAEPGVTLHLNEGAIELSDLLGRPYGGRYRTSSGFEYTVTRPSVVDVLSTFKRATQVIYPKDAARIAIAANVGPGSRVVEAGTGSGYLTAVLAFLVRPLGVVYTYDVRRDVQALARRNLARAGLDRYVRFRLGDVRRGIIEKGVDAVVLDMPDPWNVIEEAFKALKHGGRYVCFVPTADQAKIAALKLEEEGFISVECIELLERRYIFTKEGFRPHTRMVGHTGYIIYATKP